MAGIRASKAAASAGVRSTPQKRPAPRNPNRPFSPPLSASKAAKIEKPAGGRKPSSGRGGAAAAAKHPAPANEEKEEKPLTREEQGFNKAYSVLKFLMRHRWGYLFLRPVDAVALNLPDYEAVITQPMDLGTCDQKFQDKKYKNLTDLHNDISLTFDNAMRYNDEPDAVHQIAKKLKAVFETKWKKVEEFMGCPNEDACRECGRGGRLALCDFCPAAFHAACLPSGCTLSPDGEDWKCPDCAQQEEGPSKAQAVCPAAQEPLKGPQAPAGQNAAKEREGLTSTSGEGQVAGRGAREVDPSTPEVDKEAAATPEPEQPAAPPPQPRGDEGPQGDPGEGKTMAACETPGSTAAGEGESEGGGGPAASAEPTTATPPEPMLPGARAHRGPSPASQETPPAPQSETPCPTTAGLGPDPSGGVPAPVSTTGIRSPPCPPSPMPQNPSMPPSPGPPAHVALAAAAAAGAGPGTASAPPPPSPAPLAPEPLPCTPRKTRKRPRVIQIPKQRGSKSGGEGLEEAVVRVEHGGGCAAGAPKPGPHPEGEEVGSKRPCLEVPPTPARSRQQAVRTPRGLSKHGYLVGGAAGGQTAGDAAARASLGLRLDPSYWTMDCLKKALKETQCSGAARACHSADSATETKTDSSDGVGRVEDDEHASKRRASAGMTGMGPAPGGGCGMARGREAVSGMGRYRMRVWRRS